MGFYCPFLKLSRISDTLPTDLALGLWIRTQVSLTGMFSRTFRFNALAEVPGEKLSAGKKFYKNAERLSVCLGLKSSLQYLFHRVTTEIGWKILLKYSGLYSRFFRIKCWL